MTKPNVDTHPHLFPMTLAMEGGGRQPWVSGEDLARQNRSADIIDLSERYRRHQGETSDEVIAQYITTLPTPAWVEALFWGSVGAMLALGAAGICLALLT